MAKGSKAATIISEIENGICTLVPGVSVTLSFMKENWVRGISEPGEFVEFSFKVGDTANYDSWNFHYEGVIEKITPTGVWIRDYPGSSSSRLHKLKPQRFHWLNKQPKAYYQKERNEWYD